jgi:hypothetical protein
MILAPTAADGSQLGSSSDDVDALLTCRALAMRADVRRGLPSSPRGADKRLKLFRLVGIRLAFLVGIRVQLHVTFQG